MTKWARQTSWLGINELKYYGKSPKFSDTWKIEHGDPTTEYCVQKMQTEWQTV